MRVTVQHTLKLEDMPNYIEAKISELSYRLDRTAQTLSGAVEDAKAQRYINMSELLDETRQKLTMIDANMSEIQSVSLSYEKIRIEQNLSGSPDPENTNE